MMNKDGEVGSVVNGGTVFLHRRLHKETSISPERKTKRRKYHAFVNSKR